jgi:hypothetical protein
MKRKKVSEFDPEITINYYTDAEYGYGGAGWHLEKNGVVDSPLLLIEDEEIRNKVRAEADQLVWPKAFIIDIDLESEYKKFWEDYEMSTPNAIALRLGLKGKGSFNVAKKLYQYVEYKIAADTARGEGRSKEAIGFDQKAKFIYFREIRPVCRCGVMH